MKINEYQELAMTTLNPELSKRDVLINSVMGLCGESGEAIDIVKKWMAQGHELDKEHLAKELGDVAWYLAEAATALDISLEDIFKANIDKLKMRYPDGFETKKSLVRLKGDINSSKYNSIIIIEISGTFPALISSLIITQAIGSYWTSAIKESKES